MSETQIQAFEKNIRLALPHHADVDAAAASIEALMRAAGVPMDEATLARLAEAAERVRKSLQSIEILRKGSLIKPKDNWYSGPKGHDRHWPALKSYLKNAKSWDDESVESIDESSNEVVSLLENPAHDQFRCRGLVVGYVQSGKTANMTAVIAKAVDAGYNLVVLLAGVTNKLRSQTQKRIESDICERHRTLWQLYTTSDDSGDFTIPANRSFSVPIDGGAQLAVIKKETKRLEAFLHVLEKTPVAVLGKIKALILDDECDQASVNTGSELDPTEINKRIRLIISRLPAVAYVGYTATPFANVFINPFTGDNELDDLYPEDFITALPRPINYFGAREVFGFAPDDALSEDGPSAGQALIRTVLPEEAADVRRGKRKPGGKPVIVGQLERALIWFVLSCAVRRSRGHVSASMTMLIHTSVRTDHHDWMASEVRAWLAENGKKILEMQGDPWDLVSEVWEQETNAFPLREGGDLNPQTLHPFIVEVLSALEVIVENSVSDERLNYHSHEPKTYVVIGGSVLARGLTLDGLAVSYFLRTSRQYDTLLQMGRWFGYRHGYEDLPRLWTTGDLISSFRSLANVEEELREEIRMYRDMRLTPLEFAVRIRQVPGLAITAAGKMRHAYKTSISFEGRHIQTIRFDHRNPSVVSKNWSAASGLIDAILAGRNPANDERLFRGVPVALIRKFLASYDVSSHHLDLSGELLINYIDAACGRGHLQTWNVGVVAPVDGPKAAMPLGSLGRVGMNRRSRLASDEPYADIKALMSKADVLLDAEGSPSATGLDWENLKALRPEVPLLILYPIDRVSNPQTSAVGKTGAPRRVALDAIGDLIGIGIVFPGKRDRAGTHYSVMLDVPTPEQLMQEDAEVAG